jgi:ribonuclease HII
MLKIENELHEKGYKYIACIDEVGRGCLAGDVTACAIIMPEKVQIEGVNDSKKLSKKKREIYYDEIKNAAISIGIGTASFEEIDKLNIKKATHLAMERAVENLLDKDGNLISPDFLLIDAETIALKIPQEGIIKGDAKCHGIAAASIIAKVTRDKRMAELHEEYPVYNFKKNAGYGTKEHIDALLKNGKCKIHRNTFIRKILDRNEQLKLL